jgi:hypothetical protein
LEDISHKKEFMKNTPTRSCVAVISKPEDGNKGDKPSFFNLLESVLIPFDVVVPPPVVAVIGKWVNGACPIRTSTSVEAWRDIDLSFKTRKFGARI